MNMKNKIKVIVLVVLAVVVVFALVSINGSSKQEVSRLDATDTAVGFYDKWLAAVESTETDPYKEDLAKSPILSKELKEKIKEAKKSESIDPVLCQTKAPEDISTRRVSELEKEVQILITSKDKNVSEQTLVTLKKLNGGWYIDDISCSAGEVAPEREFSFEEEGFLLKDSIPAPFDSNNWHLVFEEDGVAGHVVPLIFDSESQCVDLDGNKAVCDSSRFVEATKVSIKGQMTERGANVKILEFVK